jgi:hypothetical protein
MQTPTPVDQVPVNAPWWYREWVRPYIADSALWAIAIAVAGHIAVAIAPLLLGVIRTGHPLAWVMLLLVVAGSLQVIRFEVSLERRPAGLTVMVLGTWMLSGVIAWVALETGFL